MVDTVQIWQHTLVSSVTAQPYNQVSWVYTDWATEDSNPRSPQITSWSSGENAYDAPAVITVTDPSSTGESDPAIVNILGGCNDGDVIVVEGSYTAGGRTFPLNASTTILGTQDSNGAAAQVAQTVAGIVGISATFSQNDAVNNPNHDANVDITVNTAELGESITLTGVTYTPSNPVIPTPSNA